MVTAGSWLKVKATWPHLEDLVVGMTIGERTTAQDISSGHCLSA